MSDPLSIAAGVVGILTAATQISTVLIKFIRANKEAPQQARNIITELNETNLILSSLQAFLLGSKSANESMTSLLKVENVVTVVSGCVLTFSELEKLVDDLKVEDPDVLDRMKWARKETIITGLIQRLQNHKASLSLILNVINGQTITEAKSSVDRLFALVETHYQDMSSRLQALERRRSSQIDMDSSIRRDETELDLVAPSKQPDLNLADIHTRRPPTLDYVKDLQKSWVYRRNYALPTSHLSVSTKSRHSTHWSVISGLSMAEVSNISVLNLLVTENETINTHRSLQTWSNLRSIPAAFVGLPGTHAYPPPLESARLSFVSDTSGNFFITELISSINCQDCTKCQKCGKEVDTTQSIKAKNDILCMDCFICGTCNNRTGHSEYIRRDDDFFCKGCSKCHYCDKKLGQKGYVLTNDGFSCTDCFRCHICRKEICLEEYFRAQDDIFCLNCMKCHTCDREIERAHLLFTVSGLICFECFRCRICDKNFFGMDYKWSARFLFCTDCHDAVMKQRRASGISFFDRN